MNLEDIRKRAESCSFSTIESIPTGIRIDEHVFPASVVLTLIEALETAMRGLEKIVTPEHWHVDPITRSGCFQERAQEALEAVNILLEGPGADGLGQAGQ